MDAELARFFEVWVPLLRGETEPGQASDAGFYRTLMERNAAHILSALFPATRAAFVAWAPGEWSRSVADYTRAHPARSHQPNEFGRSFPEFLHQASGLAGACPERQALLAELADYEWLSYAFGAGVPAESGHELQPSYAIRQYDHDIPALGRALRAGSFTAPLAAPVTVLVYLDLTTQHSRALYPSRAALLALARRAGVEVSEAETTAALELAAAQRELEALGILAPEEQGMRALNAPE